MLFHFLQRVSIPEVHTAVTGFDGKRRRVCDAALTKESSETIAIGAHIAVCVLAQMTMYVNENAHAEVDYHKKPCTITESMAVIIIGGGIIGLSAAYHLARRRCGPIVLLEKGPVGDGSSSRAAGIITWLLWSDTGVRVRKRCLELFGELSHELDGFQFPANRLPEPVLCRRLV